MFGGLPGSKQKIGQSFPRGTTMMFRQAAAPVGWTRVTTYDDTLLRIVGTAAPGSGGSNGFAAAFNSQTATGGYTLQIADMPAHNYPGSVASTSHRYYTPDTNNGVQAPTGPSVVGAQAGINLAIASQGGGGPHSHSITTSIKYVDALIAKKN